MKLLNFLQKMLIKSLPTFCKSNNTSLIGQSFLTRLNPEPNGFNWKQKQMLKNNEHVTNL